jgi:hypothetical protein
MQATLTGAEYLEGSMGWADRESEKATQINKIERYFMVISLSVLNAKDRKVGLKQGKSFSIKPRYRRKNKLTYFWVCKLFRIE